jgi:hypothetical protein
MKDKNEKQVTLRGGGGQKKVGKKVNMLYVLSI